MDSDSKYKNSVIQQDVILSKQPIYSPSSHFFGQEKNLPDTIIGENCIICAHAVIYAGTVLGNRVYIADGANIREGCDIGDDTIIGRYVTVENNTKIGKKCKIQTGAYITGECIIENFVFVGPEACTTNDKYMQTTDRKMKGPTFKEHCRVGGNATILAEVTIGKNSVVGAGSVVTKDVPDGEIWVGNPAKFLKNA